jgi:hypothetical protein
LIACTFLSLSQGPLLAIRPTLRRATRIDPGLALRYE